MAIIYRRERERERERGLTPEKKMNRRESFENGMGFGWQNFVF